MPSLLPALHFHHMRHRVLRPAVARLDLDGAAADALRHARSRPSPPGRRPACRASRDSRACRRPGRQGARDAVAQHARIAGEEVDLVAGLQRQRVARIVDGDVLEQPARLVPAALRQPAEGCDMRPLARRAAKRQRRRVGRPGNRRRLALGREAVEIALQHMRHDEIRDLAAIAAFDRRDRVADEALQFMQRALIVCERCWRRAGQFEIESIAHGSLPWDDGIQPHLWPASKAADLTAAKIESCSPWDSRRQWLSLFGRDANAEPDQQGPGDAFDRPPDARPAQQIARLGDQRCVERKPDERNQRRTRCRATETPRKSPRPKARIAAAGLRRRPLSWDSRDR